MPLKHLLLVSGRAYDQSVSDESIAARIERLVIEEQTLRRHEEKDSPDPDSLKKDRERLRAEVDRLDARRRDDRALRAVIPKRARSLRE
jgi:hypothetical protein